ncbi:unnamed protein product [Closterium sp. NIES-53]
MLTSRGGAAPMALAGWPHRVTTAAATKLVQLPGLRQRGGLRPCFRRNGAQWRRERSRRVAVAAADSEGADGGGESAEAEESSPALAAGAEAGKGEGSNIISSISSNISSGSESESGGDAESREWEGDLQYMMSWQWDDVVRFWRASGASEDQITSEEFESLREWWSTSARYWQRDGRLDGKTLWDVVEMLRRWELDGWFRVFETAMSPEMEFALESVVEGKEETFVGEEWMDRLTPRGIREANERRLTGDTGARGLLGAGDAGVVDVGGGAGDVAVEGEGEGEGDVSEEERKGVEQRWREMMEESMVRVLQGQTTMANGAAGAAGESGEGNTGGSSGGSGSTRRVRSNKWVGARPGDLPSLTHRPPRDWPPPGWQVDADELAVIHGAAGGEKGGGRGGEAGVEEEERVREERWGVFMKQYEAWAQANKEILDEEAAVADPIYFPGRRKTGNKYRPGLYELPFVEAGQVYTGRVTTINLNEGCFIDIGAVHDGWVPIYNDDWYELRQVLSIGTPVLVEVTAKRDPFRFRFPIELRLLNPDVDDMIFRRQRYPPHAPIFSRDGDFNLNELAVEVRRPKLPFVKRAFFPNRWERLFVEESEQQEEDFRHPYIQHVERIQGAERMLVQRVRRGEVVTQEDVASMLPEPADAALVDLAAAEEELKWDEEEAAAVARGEVVDAPPSRHDVLRASLAAVHQQRLQAEQDAVTRDRAARTEVGLPIYEPGREKLVRQIGGGKEEWWRYMSFLYTAVDLALFPNGIPDETAARQAADEALIEAVVGSAAPSSSPSSAAPSAGSLGSDGGAGDL